jgi:hypothetical protein
MRYGERMGQTHVIRMTTLILSPLTEIHILADVTLVLCFVSFQSRSAVCTFSRHSVCLFAVGSASVESFVNIGVPQKHKVPEMLGRGQNII